MRLSTNIDEVIGRENAKIEQLIKSDKVLRIVAGDAKAMIVDRVQQHGKKSDGTLIKTKAKKKFGAYSASWGKVRNENNRQTDIIDLTNEGDMFSDWDIEPIGENEYAVGFKGQKSSDKAQYAEDYFGEIFTPTKDEEEFLLEQLNKKLGEIFG